jgi:hypothetical protein
MALPYRGTDRNTPNLIALFIDCEQAV